MMSLVYEHAHPYSVVSQYDLNSQLNSPALTSLQTYLFMHLNYEWGFFGCIVFISTLTTQLFSFPLVPERLTASNPEQIPSQSLAGIYIL